MVSLVNRKWIVLVVMFLIIGIGSGYAFSYEERLRLQSEIGKLESEISSLTTNYNNLNTTYNQLRESYGALNVTYYNLNERYIELSQGYVDVLFHYNLLNKPASDFTTIKDLNITLILHHTTYYYQDPVSGNVAITYLNGTVFEGSFILYIRHLTKETMSTTASILISGFTEFYLSPPVFRFGPGNYAIGISSLSTTDGYIIESRWQVFPSVQVEAK